MKRELTVAEANMAQKIADVIGRLDELVFPENPVKKIVVVKASPPNEKLGAIGYVPPENTEDGIDFYQIFGYGIDEDIAREKRKRVILLSTLKKKRYKDLPKITLKEIIIGGAAHEVRHRVQRHLSIEWFIPENASTVKNYYAKEMIRFIKLLCEKEPPEGDFRQEFDAKVIEYMVTELWHWGKIAHSNVASIIKAGAKDLQPLDEILKFHTGQ